MPQPSAPGYSAARMLAQPSDGALLSRFVAASDKAAFGTLVERHAPMVRSVCRRVLQHQQDTEDAFQESFVVAMRKAASICNVDSLQSWLYKVAPRTANDVRKSRCRHNKHKCPCDDAQLAQLAQLGDNLGLTELVDVINEEMQHLPEKYRLPFVLHCLEGKSETETAAELGLTKGQVASRVRKAREFLQPRLARHGIYPPGQPA